MGWLNILLSAFAGVLLYDTGHTVLLVLAVGATIGSFWSWGIMHNYATQAAKRRPSYRGGFHDIRVEEADSVPDWIAFVNFGFSAVGLLLLITAAVIRW